MAKSNTNSDGFQRLPNGELIKLDDLTFDFEDYFARYLEQSNMPYEEGNEFSVITKEEGDVFEARVYGMFCRDVFNSVEGDTVTLPFWVVNFIAEKLIEGLHGHRWELFMNLPWDVPEYLTPKGLRALGIYSAVEDALRKTPDANVTDLISEEAKKHNVSYETARADYYAYKKIIKGKNGIPSRFLIEKGKD
jgi:hypothetical protein